MKPAVWAILLLGLLAVTNGQATPQPAIVNGQDAPKGRQVVLLTASMPANQDEPCFRFGFRPTRGAHPNSSSIAAATSNRVQGLLTRSLCLAIVPQWRTTRPLTLSSICLCPLSGFDTWHHCAPPTHPTHQSVPEH